MWTEDEVNYALTRIRWVYTTIGFVGGVVFCLVLGSFA